MSSSMPVMVDIEASGFGRKSYPIEIGLVDELENAHCYLILPQQDWTYWDRDAEAVHGITQQVLAEHGRTAQDVADSLNVLMQGKTLYSDAWSFDMPWMGRLFDAVDIPQLFRIGAIPELLSQPQLENWDKTKQQVMNDYNLQRHRASSDARINQETFRRVVSIA